MTMKREVVVFRTELDASPEAAFAWHERRGAFERLTPPWERARLIEQTDGIRNGSRVRLETREGPLTLRWLFEHRDYEPESGFSDVLLRGPLKHWHHRRCVEALGSSKSAWEDRIEFEISGGAVARGWLRRRLERIFAYRHETLRRDLEAHRQFGAPAPLRILVSGATGFIGSALVPYLRTQGHHVTRLVRSRPGTDDLLWDPPRPLGERGLEDFDAVVHLAGENLAAGRWSAARKRAILESRIAATRVLVDALRGSGRGPRTFISASAIGFYGDRGEECLSEEAPSGPGFLGEVCRAWEGEAERARESGARCVRLRFGLVVSPAGGALAKMLPVFRAGLGGRLGSGRQWISWIAIDDLLDAVQRSLIDPRLEGAVNAVSPYPVRNSDWSRLLGRALGRPAVALAPAPLLKAAFGQLAQETLLASTRVAPERLERAGHRFRYPLLGAAFKHLLGGSRAENLQDHREPVRRSEPPSE